MIHGKHNPGFDANNSGGVMETPFDILETEVSIDRLKKIALQLREPLKSLILSAPTRMGRREYAIKVGEWLKLLEMEK